MGCALVARPLVAQFLGSASRPLVMCLLVTSWGASPAVLTQDHGIASPEVQLHNAAHVFVQLARRPLLGVSQFQLATLHGSPEAVGCRCPPAASHHGCGTQVEIPVWTLLVSKPCSLNLWFQPLLTLPYSLHPTQCVPGVLDSSWQWTPAPSCLEQTQRGPADELTWPTQPQPQHLLFAYSTRRARNQNKFRPRSAALPSRK